MSGISLRFPADPYLTANLYFASRQDQVLDEVVEPLVERLRKSPVTRGDFLWWVRYGRRGEHVKLRVHGSGEERDDVCRCLEELAAACFARHADAPASERKTYLHLPPIDLQDAGDEPHPDASLLLTDYRRGPINLAAAPFFERDDYVLAATRCLAAGAAHILASGKVGPATAAARQGILVQLLVAALPVLGPVLGDIERDRAAYLAYHRDWLLRFHLQRRGVVDPAQLAASVAGLDAHIDRLRERSLGPTARLLASRWRGAPPSPVASPTLEAWVASLAELRAVVTSIVEDPAFHIDPYAPRPEDAPYFKALHGMANQLGIDMLNESYVHHLVLRALESLDAGEAVA